MKRSSWYEVYNSYVDATRVIFHTRRIVLYIIHTEFEDWRHFENVMLVVFIFLRMDRPGENQPMTIFRCPLLLANHPEDQK